MFAMRRLEEREFKRINVAAPPTAPAMLLLSHPTLYGYRLPAISSKLQA